MYGHQYDQDRAAKLQDATEEMIRMRQPVEKPQPVAVETATGWMVISQMLRTGSVTPPYRYQYDMNHFEDLTEAYAHYHDLEAGEYRGWSAVAIVPCRHGVPLGAKKVFP